MLNEDEFVALSTQIVDQCFPDERKFWSVNKRQITSRIFRAETLPTAVSEQPGDFKFLGDLQAAMSIASEAASLISAMVAIYTTLRETKAKGTTDAALVQIKQALSDSGLAMEKVAKISELVGAWPSRDG
jgi:hypothetical protein